MLYLPIALAVWMSCQLLSLSNGDTLTYDKMFVHITFIVKTESNKETCINAQQQGQTVNCLHSG